METAGAATAGASSRAALVSRNGSALAAFRIPGGDFSGFMISASHSDAPCLRVKENAELAGPESYVRLNVEKYGGVPPFQETQNYIKKVLAYAGEDIDLSGVFGGAVTGGGVSGIQSWIAELEELAAGGSAFDSAGTLFSQEDAQYMVEMMRLQMQNIFQKEVFSDEEEEGTSAVGSLL